MEQKSVYDGVTTKFTPAEIMFNKQKGKKPEQDIVELVIFYTNGGKITYIINDIWLGFEFNKHYSLTDICGNSRMSLPPESINELDDTTVKP